MTQQTLTASTWSLFPHFVLRSTGFPFTWIADMRLKETEEVLVHIFRWEEKRNELLRDWEQRLSPQLTDRSVRWEKEQQKALTKLFKRVKKGSALSAGEYVAVQTVGHDALNAWLVAWQETLAHVDRLYHQAELAFAHEVDLIRQHLHERIGHPRYREAVYLSNPSFYERGFTYFDQHRSEQARDSRWRQLERQFFTYLQRFVAKNETTSFFGPINYGQVAAIDANESRPLIEANWPHTLVLEKRTAFYAFWVLQELAALIASDAELEDVLPLYAAGSSKRTNVPSFVEGQSVREWAERSGQVFPEARQRAAEHIANKRWQRKLPIPSSEVHGMAYLIERVQQLPITTATEQAAQSRWLGILAQFQRLQQQFEQADLAQREAIMRQAEAQFSALTALATRRGEGELFRDRTMLYEDAKGNLDVQFDARLFESVKPDLEQMLQVASAYTVLRQRRLMKTGLAIFQEAFGSCTEVRYDQFIVACHKHFQQQSNTGAPIVAPEDELDHFLQAFQEAVESYLAGRSTALLSDDLTTRLQGVDVENLWIVSPDLLLLTDPMQVNQTQSNPARVKWVLGELHHGITMEGWMLSFHNQVGQVREDIRREIKRHVDNLQTKWNRHVQPANLIFSRKMKTAPQEYPGITVEWSGFAAHRQPDQVFGVKELVVRVVGEELVLTRAADEQEIRFYPPAFGYTETAFFPFALFSFPIAQMPTYRRPGYTPRVETERLVIQRAQWQFTKDELADIVQAKSPFSAYVALQTFRRVHRIPRHVFLRVRSEQKPVYLDLENPYALDLLQHLAAKNQEVVLGEMLPAPNQLWLRDGQGAYCSEIRTLLMRS